jgi:O-antigen/teichoic acid export membrane protein
MRRMPTTPLAVQTSASPELTGPASQPKSAEAQDLLRRAPMGYLWNQIGSLWMFGASFLFTILVARELGKTPYGVLAVALTVYNTAVYFAAFGLEDATTVFLPRTLAEQGRDAAAQLIRRTMLTRGISVAIVAFLLVMGIPALASFLSLAHLPGDETLTGALRVPGLDTLALPVAAYMVGTGLMNQLSAIFTSLLRTRLTTLVNGLGQLANLLVAYFVMRAGHGVNGVLWGVAGVSLAATALYTALLTPFWLRRGPRLPAPSFMPVLHLGSTAWLTNLVSGALLKQVAVSLLGAYLISTAAIGYFNLAFQLTHAAAFLLIAGLGGVGLAAMSAAYSGNDLGGLASAWRAVSKVQILLAVPLLAFCMLHAQAIAIVLYSEQYAAVGPLMTIFLGFNILQRLAGGGSHQAALYVLGKQRLSLALQLVGLVITIVLGVLLIPTTGSLGGPAGALIAVGAGQVAVEVMQLAAAWRLLRRKYPLRFGLRVCLALIAPVVVASVIHPSAWSWLPSHFGPVRIPISLFELIVSVILFTALLIVGLVLAKPIEHEDVDLLADVNPRLRPILTPFASGAPSPRMLVSRTPTNRLIGNSVTSQTTTKRRATRPAPQQDMK